MSSPIALPEIFKAAFEDFVIPSYETAPFSTIQNRAKVTRSLKAIAGVERVMLRNLAVIPDEFGPNGEVVYKSDDLRARFVGNGWTAYADGFGGGPRPCAIAIGVYAEITFYGTGINLLALMDGNTRTFTVSIDGGASVSYSSAGNSSIFVGRNYSHNQPVNLATGLSLEWHTVRITNTSGNGVNIYGFEILNQRTDLAVYAGAGISNGSSQGLSTLTTSAFNAGVVGTRGARVVKYVQGGVVSQAVQEVDATQKNLTLADHSNEEVVRRINYREFGANRADDFSTLGGTLSNRAFTLDDGTTTLVGSNIAVYTVSGIEGIGWSTATFFTLTFVGTGLDVVDITASLTGPNIVITLDGVSLGNMPQLAGTKKRTICSGLPYGTHTVRFANGSPSANDWIISDFIIYQPKKPAIPAGALEIADYNVMADYVASSGVLTGGLGSGVLRKGISSREAVYAGTWTLSGILDTVSFDNFFNTNSLTTSSSCEYSFFGTGFEIKIYAISAQINNQTLTVDGSSNLSSFTTSISQAASGATFTAATGLLAGTNSASQRITVRVSGLALGFHTFKWTKNSAVTSYIDVVDIITPIHAQESSFKVGSNSLKSVTKYSPEKSVANAGPDLSKAKAWVSYDLVNSKILASFNISAVLKKSTGFANVYFEKPFKTENYVPVAFGNIAQTDFDNIKANYVDVALTNSAGAATDGIFMAVFFGELIDDL